MIRGLVRATYALSLKLIDRRGASAVVSCTIEWSVRVRLVSGQAMPPRRAGAHGRAGRMVARAVQAYHSRGGAPAPLLTRHRAQGGPGFVVAYALLGPQRWRREADRLRTRLPRLALVLPAPPDRRVVVPSDRRVRQPARDRSGDLLSLAALAVTALRTPPRRDLTLIGAGLVGRHRGADRARRPRRALQAQPVSRRPALRARRSSSSPTRSCCTTCPATSRPPPSRSSGATSCSWRDCSWPRSPSSR